MEKRRYFLELAYRGGNYHGWQIQGNAHTVQAELEKAIHTVLGQPVGIMGSGRTDTGVHASFQVAHMDWEGELDGAHFVRSLNGILPKDMSLFRIREVKADAHARFDAKWRSYTYKITLQKNPFLEGLAWQIFHAPDIQKMNEAATLLLEWEDFQCFSKVHTDVNHFNCKIKVATWEQIGPELFFQITANRFLRGMVRAIVGTLLAVGHGKIDRTDFQKILESRERSQAKSAAPAHGLYLCNVVYPEDIYL